GFKMSRPQGDRVMERRSGLGGTLLSQKNRSDVVMGFGKGRLKLDGPRAKRQGFVQPGKLLKDDRGIDVKMRGVGVERQSAMDQGDGLVWIGIDQNTGKIADGVSVVRAELDGGAERCDGLFSCARVTQRQSKIVVRFGRLGVQTDAGSQRVDR